MATIRNLGRSAAGRAAAFSQIAPVFANVGKTVSGIFEKKEARERADEKIKREQPALDQASKLRGLQIGDLEVLKKLNKVEIGRYKYVIKRLLDAGATKESIEQLGPKEVLKIAEDPFAAFEGLGHMLGPDSELGQKTMANLTPEQKKTWQGMVSGDLKSKKADDAQETDDERRDRGSEEAKKAGSEAVASLLGGINPQKAKEPELPVAGGGEPSEEVDEPELKPDITSPVLGPKILKPGERAEEKPTTSVTKFDTEGNVIPKEGEDGTPLPEEEDEEKLPANVIRAKQFFEVLDSIPGSYDIRGIAKTVEHHQKVLDNFRGSQGQSGKLSDIDKLLLKDMLDTKREKASFKNKTEEREARQKFTAEQNERKIAAQKANQATIQAYKAQADKNKRDNPIKRTSTTAQAAAITEAGAALVRFKQLEKILVNNEADIFNRAPFFGGFVNPELDGVMAYLKNRLGRKDSGAAINADEWKTFEKLILDTKTLITPKGRAAALKKVRDHIGDFFASGKRLTNDSDWFSTYEANAAEGVRLITGGNQDDKTSNSLADMKKSLADDESELAKLTEGEK